MTYGLNALLTNKQPKNDFLKKNKIRYFDFFLLCHIFCLFDRFLSSVYKVL